MNDTEVICLSAKVEDLEKRLELHRRVLQALVDLAEPEPSLYQTWRYTIALSPFMYDIAESLLRLEPKR